MDSHDGTHVQFQSFNGDASESEITDIRSNSLGFGQKVNPKLDKETYGLTRLQMNKIQAEIDYRR